MDRETLQAIRRLQTSAPVNIVDIAKYIGISVWEDDDLPDGISGKIFRDNANGLAADLLMPWRLLSPVSDRPVGELAQMFQVSEAMSIRLRRFKPTPQFATA